MFLVSKINATKQSTNVQVADISWCSEICWVYDTAGHDESLALGHTDDLTSTRPPIPLCSIPAFARVSSCVPFCPESTSVG